MSKSPRSPWTSESLARYKKQRQAWEALAERLATPPKKRDQSGKAVRPGKRQREAQRAAHIAAEAERAAQLEAERQAAQEAQKAEIRRHIQEKLANWSPPSDAGAFVVVHPCGATIVRALSDREPYIFTSWREAKEYAEAIGGTAYPANDPAVLDTTSESERLLTDTGSDQFDLLDICYIGGAFEMKRRKH